MIKKYSEETKKTFSVVRTNLKRPPEIPGDWIIFNAPRPIHGDKTWEDKSHPLEGWFYSAVDPKDDYTSKVHYSVLARNKASVVQYITEQDFLNWLEKEIPEAVGDIVRDNTLMSYYMNQFLREETTVVL